MKKLAIIGTGWISSSFVEAVQQTNSFEVVSVYSRTLEKAEEFATKHQIPSWTNQWTEFLLEILLLKNLLFYRLKSGMKFIN